ncbi:MAG: hypothetical protein RLW87_07945 [Alphaproteobacteria bacterium]
MFTYCVTFRIANKTVGGKTYNERYNLLTKNARKEDGGYWEGTTSFFLTESALTTPELGKQLCEGLSAKDDQFVVFDPSDMSGCYFGAVDNLDVLGSFFSSLMKLP